MNWYDIRDPQDKQLDELAAKYALHPLHIEDCRHRNQSAKIEAQDNYLFIVLKPAEIGDDGTLTTGDLDVFLGNDFVITVEESACKSIRDMLDRVQVVGKTLRPDQIFHRVFDMLVDAYNPMLDRLSDQIDAIEEEVLGIPDASVLERVFAIRRMLIELRRIMANSRDLLGHLLRTEHPQIRPDLTPFLRDILDHVSRNLDIIEVLRDLVTGTTELYLSSVANHTNQVVKVLTVFGTVATPAVVITGLYGMNIKHLPFADHPHSWGIVLGIIAVVSGLMMLVLRKMHWL